ncbi:MAG: type II secretion system protein GspJ [Thermodesulfobacteriota bacterium]
MRRGRGFTVVDLVVALAILAVVLSAVYAVFAVHQSALEAAAEAREVHGQALVILDRLVRDLGGAWLPQDPLEPYRFDGGRDRLDFITSAAMSLDQSAGPDLVEVGWRVVSRQEEGREQLWLVRRQDDVPDDQPGSGGREIVLTRDLVSLEIAYGGGGRDWRADWAAHRLSELPPLVRLTLVLSDGEEGEETFSTAISPALALPLVHEIKGLSGLELPF